MNTNRQKERSTEDVSFARIRRVVIVGTPAVAICTLLLVVYLFKTADNSRQAQTTMARVQVYAQSINALEWQLMAERRVDPETLAELRSAREELRAAVSRLPSQTQPGRTIQEFMPALANYLTGVDQEVHLAEEGKFEEARKFDAEEVDPHFDVLQQKIKELSEEYGQRAESVIYRSEIGMIIGAVLATSIILVLFHRFERAKHRTKEALEEIQRQHELILTKDALRQAEEKYRRMFEDAIVGIFQTTPDGHYLSMNRALARMYGDESPEKRIAEITDIGSQAYVDPGKREEFKRLMEEQGAVRNFEYEVRRRDGSKIWFSENARAVRDASGKVLYYEGTVEDITEGKRVEAALQHSEEKYRLLLESIPNVVWSSDQEGKTYFISPNVEMLSGYTVEEIYAAGERLRLENIHPDDADPVKQAYQDLYRTRNFDMEYRIRRKDGSWIWVHDRAVSVFEKDGVSYAYGVLSDVTERKRAEEELKQANQKLSIAANDMERRARETTRLSEMGDLLQSCQTLEEAYRVIARAAEQLFPSTSGAVCITAASRNLVEVAAVWGPSPPAGGVFPPTDCWALRRGRLHYVPDPGSPLRCRHWGDSNAQEAAMCVPMMALGEALGILHVNGNLPQPGVRDKEQPSLDAEQRLAVAMGEHAALALANLNLRETLRSQSIRDPLTGLHNRRYMEESLERELHGAVRKQRPLSLIMLDIDHFKRFNDTFGHEAGDVVLRQIGAFLQEHVRGEDIASRYGGEEFVLILVEAPIEVAQQRAEQIRAEMKQMMTQYRGQSLGTITVSLGVASFPEGAQTAEALLHAADQALYRAKAAGRNRVMTAHAG